MDKLAALFKLLVLGTDEEGNEQELALSKGFIHKVSVMVICYILGVATAAIPVLNYLGVTRPALIAEVYEIRDVASLNQIRIEIEFYKQKLDIATIKLDIKRDELLENELSIDYAKETIPNVDERTRLITAYKHEANLLETLIAQYMSDATHAANKIASLEMKKEELEKDK